MGRNGVALLASWDNPSAEKGGWGFGGRGAALPPPLILSRGQRSSIRLSRWSDLGLGLGVMARAEERWGAKNRRSYPLLIP